MPIEASVEDLHDLQPLQRCVQSDAQAVSGPQPLEEKLNQELQYHKHGNYSSPSQADAANGYLHSSSNSFLPNWCPDHTVGQVRPTFTSSVQSFTKAAAVHPTSQEESWCRPSGDYAQATNSIAPSKPHLSTSATAPSLSQFNQEYPHSVFGRQQSWPTFLATDTTAPEISAGSLLAPSQNRLLQDQGANPCACRRVQPLAL